MSDKTISTDDAAEMRADAAYFAHSRDARTKRLAEHIERLLNERSEFVNALAAAGKVTK